MTAFKTFSIKRLDNGYEKLSYFDRKFYNRFVKTDDWWDLDYLPSGHNRFDLKKFTNQLQAYSDEHKNPPVVEFIFNIRSIRLKTTPFIGTHEDVNRLLHLDEIIVLLRKIISKLGRKSSGFVVNAEFICKIRKSKNKRRKTNIPRGLRHEVFKRDNYRCVECGASKDDGATLHIDHIIPVSKGGTDELSNLQTVSTS